MYDKDFDNDTEIESKNCMTSKTSFLKREILDNEINFSSSKSEEIPYEKKYLQEKVCENVAIKCEFSDCDTIGNFVENCLENLKYLEKVDNETKSLYEYEREIMEENSLSSLSCNDEYLPNKVEDIQNNILDNSYDNQISLLNSIGLSENIVNDSAFLLNHIQEETKDIEARDFEEVYLEDHCYTKLKCPQFVTPVIDENVKKSKCILGKNKYNLDCQNLFDKDKYKIDVPLEYLTSVSQIVYYLFKRLPLVSDLAKDFNYTCLYPYTAVSMDQYLSWSSVKQFCAEVNFISKLYA